MAANDRPLISVLISTYNLPHYLRRVLLGFACQTDTQFEIVVADDGSTGETRDVIDAFARDVPFPVRHCRHEDIGFRKTVILNLAIAATKGDYLIFTDGDCIPRKDFVAIHRAQAQPGAFLSGGVEFLSRDATDAITEDMIATQTIFNPAWIARNREKQRLFGKVNRNPLIQTLARHFSPTAATFNGNNTSAWKSDIVAVNGFDERMVYGGLDRELGERLVNNGIHGKSVRYDAILVHQWHSRPYKTTEGRSANDAIRDNVRTAKIRWTDHGMVKR